MKHKIRIFFLALCAALALGDFQTVSAYDNPCERYGAADVVFVGKYVKEVSDAAMLEPPKLSFEVVESFLGAEEKSRLLVNVGDSVYWQDYKIGEAYLIYATKYDNSDELSAPWGNSPVSSVAADLQFLRNLPESEGLGMRVFGDVSEDVLTVENEALKRKIISNVKIRFEKVGAKDVFFETSTDFDGNYEIMLPAGNYNVEPVLSSPIHKKLSPVLHRPPVVNAKDGGCLEHSFWMRNDVTVGGKLLHADGTPVREALVSLVALEGEINSDAVDTEKTDKAGKFEFENIPAGRYFLVLNYFDEENYEPDELEEMEEELDGRIFPKFFYPNTKEKAKAKIIEIALGQTPKPLEFRLPARFTLKKIQGTVLWEDGSPANGAIVKLKSTGKNSDFKGSEFYTERDGKFILHGFTGGEYYIRARGTKKIGDELVEFCVYSEKFKIDKAPASFKLIIKGGACLD